MRKFGHGLSIFFKVIGCYITIFLFAVLLLGFESKKPTPLEIVDCQDYASELKAQRVMRIESYYGAVRFDIEVDKIDEEEIIIARTLIFAKRHELRLSHYLYTSPDDSLYLVVTEDYNIYVEK